MNPRYQVKATACRTRVRIGPGTQRASRSDIGADNRPCRIGEIVFITDSINSAGTARPRERRSVRRNVDPRNGWISSTNGHIAERTHTPAIRQMCLGLRPECPAVRRQKSKTMTESRILVLHFPGHTRSAQINSRRLHPQGHGLAGHRAAAHRDLARHRPPGPRRGLRPRIRL